MVVKWCCQGQRAGIRSVHWRLVRVRRAGIGEELAAAGAGGLDGLVGEPDLGGPAAEVVRERGDHGPGAVGVHAAGGEVREALGL